jgi:hypothetical protein
MEGRSLFHLECYAFFYFIEDYTEAPNYRHQNFIYINDN